MIVNDRWTCLDTQDMLTKKPEDVTLHDFLDPKTYKMVKLHAHIMRCERCRKIVKGILSKEPPYAPS